MTPSLPASSPAAPSAPAEAPAAPPPDGGYAANAEYLRHAYSDWRRDSAAVDAGLARFFEGFEFAQAGLLESASTAAAAGSGDPEAARRQSAVDSLVFHYRALGHRIAQINPLGGDATTHPELDPGHYGLSDTDLDREFASNHMPLYERATLRQITTDLHATYCGALGVEYMHIQDTAERRWLQERMEGSLNKPGFTHPQHLRILWKLKQAERFEQFLHTTYKGQKRFGLEGAETLIPALDMMIENAPGRGIDEVVFGMAHRGRLNVLANVIGKSYDDIFTEFEANYQVDATHGDGDVKYHKGYSRDVTTGSGATVHLSLTDNPSHLEMVGPVVQGKVRAKQALRGDTERLKVLPVIIHGDAAFAGQGIIAETFNMSQLKGYRTGGTVHFVVNNQVGFTTTAQDYLSGVYCTDMAKMVAAPIFHVNGDSPEHVLHALEMAVDYRQKFKKDVVVDMWCYRRHGHNEQDEPAFTQPILYAKIDTHETVDDLYAAELARRGEPTQEETEAVMARFEARLEEAKRTAAAGPRRPEETNPAAAAVAGGHGANGKALGAAASAAAEGHNGEAVHELVKVPAVAALSQPLGGYWRRLKREYSHAPIDTGAPYEHMTAIAAATVTYPEGFEPHRKIRKLMEDFHGQVSAGPEGRLKWAEAEALAFGTLLLQGHGVRLSGEDSGRGTFSQRHAVLYDQPTGAKYIPLTALQPDQPEFCCYDSCLAELAVLAFDYGYSVADPAKLVMWEAQFGDFANGAQVIIDQFIAAGESKWGRMSGLTLLLPHGYEGQGPEHSNAWLRRYLTLCAEENMQVVNASTPAQYFHVLRRQVLRDFRRPLVVMTPKSLLREPLCTSPVSDLTEGSFHEILDDPRQPASPRRVVFCSGKVYYDLLKRAVADGVDDVALVRVEQLYPINDDVWDAIAAKYGDVPEWAWASEEPTNYGAWGFMHALMSTLYDGPIWYVGRARSASPATGSYKMHNLQQDLLTLWALKPGLLEPALRDGVGVFRRGVELWHRKVRAEEEAEATA